MRLSNGPLCSVAMVDRQGLQRQKMRPATRTRGTGKAEIVARAAIFVTSRSQGEVILEGKLGGGSSMTASSPPKRSNVRTFTVYLVTSVHVLCTDEMLHFSSTLLPRHHGIERDYFL